MSRRSQVQLLQLERYAMRRYYASWRVRNTIMATVWFNAAEIAARQFRTLYGDPMPKLQGAAAHFASMGVA